MKIIHCKNLRFISFEGLFRYMIRNNLKKIKYRLEDHGVKGKVEQKSYEQIKEILKAEKYNIDDIVSSEINK